MVKMEEDWKLVGFKEWQVVCDALESGEQSLILRKGGISEGKFGFQWIHDRFFLFPTFFHEQVDQVRPDVAGNRRTIQKPSGGDGRDEVALQLYAETIETGRLSDWEAVRKLAGEHIWTEEVIRERFDWGEDEPGISFARVKIWRLPEPWVLANRKGFGGCRSWIGLPAEESGSLSVADRLRRAEPVAVAAAAG